MLIVKPISARGDVPRTLSIDYLSFNIISFEQCIYTVEYFPDRCGILSLGFKYCFRDVQLQHTRAHRKFAFCRLHIWVSQIYETSFSLVCCEQLEERPRRAICCRWPASSSQQAARLKVSAEVCVSPTPRRAAASPARMSAAASPRPRRPPPSSSSRRSPTTRPAGN